MPLRAAAVPSEWDQMVPLWLHGRPESTRDVYRPVIQDFKDFVKAKPISRVSLKDLQDYSDTLGTQKPRTVERKLSTVKSLLTFCFKTGMIPFDVGRALRTPKIPDNLTEKILEEDDMLRMIEMEVVPRNQVLLRVLYATGIRAAEAANLTWLNVQPRAEGPGQISVLGKGDKIRSIRVSVGTWGALMSLKPPFPQMHTPVFAKDDGRPMTRYHITIVVARAARRAGIPKHVSAHWMRHGHASHAIDRGAPLSLVRDTLGHTNLKTTSRYIHARPGESSNSYLNV